MPISGTSQTIYPRVIVLEDTLVCITPAQLTTINRTINHREHLLRQNEKLTEEISLVDEEIDLLNSELAVKDSIIYMGQSKLEISQKINEDLERSLIDQKKRSRRTFIGVGVGGTLLGVLFGMLLNNN